MHMNETRKEQFILEHRRFSLQDDEININANNADIKWQTMCDYLAKHVIDTLFVYLYMSICVRVCLFIYVYVNACRNDSLGRQASKICNQ